MYKQINAKLKTDTARIEFWIVIGFILIALLINVVVCFNTTHVLMLPGSDATINSMRAPADYVNATLPEVLFNHFNKLPVAGFLCRSGF